MYGASLLNIFSLILGLAAWILPAVNIFIMKKIHIKRFFITQSISLACCAISICFQMLYTAHLVKIEDISAILDVTPAMSVVCLILLIVTIILNIIGFIVFYKKRSLETKK